MKISYYPGCTLKTKARNLEASAIAAMARLGVELEEIPHWNCCGAVYSLAEDDIMHQLAPVRTLIRVKEQGRGKVVTLCSMCYNTLARANELIRKDGEKRKTINLFMDEEIDYHGEVEVIHLLRFLHDHIGWETLAKRISVPLKDMKVAPYYGCTLQRPRDVAIEQPGRFELMKVFLETLGATSVDFPAADWCCGSYQVLVNPKASKAATSKILHWAERVGAEALVMSCPLCEFNLGRKQEELVDENIISRVIPTFYFTQLLAIALGLDPEICRFELNPQSALDLLESKIFG
jgi:heterodisulfide reductase subunit B